MTAGLPIIACVDDTSETALMIQENKCGCICPPRRLRNACRFNFEAKGRPK